MTLLSLLSSTALATLCSNTSYPYLGQTVSVPLTAVTGNQRGIKGTVAAPKISGTFTITGGCSFTIKAFSFAPSANTVYQWYGVLTANATQGVQLAIANLNAVSGADTSFNLITDATVLPPYSYADINKIELFDVTNQVIWATASLPVPAPVTTTAAPAVSTPAAAATSAPTTVSGNAKSDAVSLEFGSFVLAIMALI